MIRIRRIEMAPRLLAVKGGSRWVMVGRVVWRVLGATRRPADLWGSLAGTLKQEMAR